MKQFAKRLANALAGIVIFPAVLSYWAWAALMGQQRTFQGWSQGMSLWPGLIGVYLRRAFYRAVLPEFGERACIAFGTIFSHPTARIGRDVYIGPFGCLGSVTVQDDVLVGSHVSIMNGSRQHGIDRLDIPVREQPGVWPHIMIGRDTWIGDRAVIMADVGQHCVIAAGAVVTKPVPDFAIVSGVPARVVRFREQSSSNGLADSHFTKSYTET